MRLLHTADWHLGRRTCRESRAADHDAMIAEIARIARDVQPDLIVHAGDLWDTARPAHDDLLRGVEALRELAAVAPVHVVCGNHDSPSLLRALGRLPGVADHVTFASEEDGPIVSVPLAAGGRARVASVPYPHPNRAADASAPGDGYRDHLRRLLHDAASRLAATADPDDRLVIGAHIHVAGAALSSGPRPVGAAEIYSAEPDALPSIDYVALGHIHRPQPVGATGRYAGSPIALDFAEAAERKSVALVTADRGGPVTTELLPIDAGRRLVSVEGDLTHIGRQAEGARGAICRVAVVGDEPGAHLVDKVRAALPGAQVVEVEDRSAAVGEPVSALTARESDSPLDELLRDYLAAAGTPGPTTDRLLARFAAISRATEREHEWTPDELMALPAPTAEALPAEAPEAGSSAPRGARVDAPR